MRLTLLLLPLALLLAACGGSSSGPATTTAATSTQATTAPTTTVRATTTAALGTLKVVLTGQDHHPLVGKPWHYEVRVTDAATGKPVRARIHLQILFSGQPVGEIGVHVVPNGVWQETIGAGGNDPFPAAARGQPLVLRATVTAKGYRPAKARWAITVK